MAWPDPQVAKYRDALAGLEDDALAALANRGLVRRARKDLEKNPPILVSADDQSLCLRIEEHDVRLARPVARSTCSCATGICRHILAALIYLRQLPPASHRHARPPDPGSSQSETPSPLESLAPLDDAALQKWAGKHLLRRAAVVLSRGFEIEQTPATVSISLPAQNITVRCLTGGLDAMLCTCHAPGPCEHKVAAILALRARQTGKPVDLPQAMLEASTGSSRTREQVRESVARLLAEMLAIGLSGLSQAAEQRLRTLATSAHGVDLPRLQRMLKALADEVSHLLRRDASASTSALLSSCARLLALCRALQNPAPTLVGVHRSLYMPVAGAIELLGLGARRWRTRSGYHGLTVLLWEPSTGRWTGWTDARPISAPGFEPLGRFDEAGPWSGCANPRQAAGTRWRVTGVLRNEAGRITARDNTRGVAQGPSAPADGPLVLDFSKLQAITEEAFAPGLGQRQDARDLVLLAVARSGEAQYDPIRQEVIREVFDADGRPVALRLSHSDETTTGLTTLQQIDSTGLEAVLGSMRIGPHGLYVEPITLWTRREPIHLTLDGAVGTLPATAAVTAPPQGETADDEHDGGDDAPGASSASAFHTLSSTAIGRHLAQIKAELAAIAESGVAVLRDLASLRNAALQLRSISLHTPAAAVIRLCDALDGQRRQLDRDPLTAAAHLLEATYLVELAIESHTLARVLHRG